MLMCSDSGFSDGKESSFEQSVKKVKKFTIDTLGRRQYYPRNSLQGINNKGFQETEHEFRIHKKDMISMDQEVVLKLELRNRDTKIKELESRNKQLESILKTNQQDLAIIQQNLIAKDNKISQLQKSETNSRLIQRHLSAKVEEKKKNITLLKEEVANKDITTEEQKINAEQLSQRIKNLEAKVEGGNIKVRQLHKENKIMRTTLQNKEYEINFMKKKVKDADASIEQLEKGFRESSDLCGSLEVENQKLKLALKKKGKEFEKLILELEDNEAQAIETRNFLQTEHTKLKVELNEKDKSIKQLKESISVLEKEEAEDKETNNALEEENTKLKKALKDREQHFVNSEFTNLRPTIEDDLSDYLLENNMTLSEALNEWQQEHQEEIMEKDRLLNEIRSQIQPLEEQLDFKDKKIHLMEKEAKNRTTKIEQLQESDQKNEMTSLRTSIKDKSHQIEMLKLVVNQMQEQLEIFLKGPIRDNCKEID